MKKEQDDEYGVLRAVIEAYNFHTGKNLNADYCIAKRKLLKSLRNARDRC